MSTSHISVLAAYREKIASGELRHDSDQEYIAAQLDELGNVLMATKERGRSLIQKLTRYYTHSNLGDGNIQGIYMYGGVGRGKSMLMDLFYDLLPVRRKSRVHFHAFMIDIHARLNDLRKNSPDISDPIPEIARQIAEESWLLCFDELQVTDIADAMILGRLFQHLFERNVVVVATSNRHPDELYKDGLQRDQFLPFIAQFKQKLNIHSLNGEVDYRLLALKSLQTTYFVSNENKERTHFLSNTFAELTHNATPKTSEIHVQGRIIPVQKCYKDIAQFSFSELCDKPLGSADYIEIAREYTTLLLADIPQLTPEKRNAAKRFVNLIDELYEHNTILICTADALPIDLYPAGDYAFEFERTVSRLIEMQSSDYLHQQHSG